MKQEEIKELKDYYQQGFDQCGEEEYHKAMEICVELLKDKEELLRLRELCDDLYFAYINKDAECPHQFEIEALEKYKQLKESE